MGLARGKIWVLHGLKVLFLLAAIGVGLSLRFDDLKVWKAREKLYFLDQEHPIFSSYDAFHFARLARDWREGRYRAGQLDPYRFVPDNFLTGNTTYPFPIPLLSWSAAKLSQWLKMPVAKLSLYYTPVTAVLFVFPLYFCLQELGFFAAGLLGSLVGVSSLIYLIRTSIARFDTDSLILFFIFGIIWCFLRYLRSEKPLSWAILAAFLILVFYWWYPVSQLSFVILSGFVGALIWRRKKKLLKGDYIALSIIFISCGWFLWRAPLGILFYLKTLVLGAKTSHESGLFRDFPNIYQSISELQKIKSFKQVSYITLANPFLFFLGFLGIGLLFFRRPQEGLLWIPVFLIGLLTFCSGNRFGLYLAPFLGIGLGVLVHELLFLSKRYFPLAPSLETLLTLFFSLLIGISILYAQKPARAFIATSKVLAPVAQDMQRLSQILPPKSWIWSWWDYGYAFEYFSHRATFIDGGTQTTPKTYYVALSFAESSPERAAKIIDFVACEGLQGIKKRLKTGETAAEITGKILSGAYFSTLPKKVKRPPIFWVFTFDLPPKYGWIGYFGTWDFSKHQGHFGFVRSISPCRKGEGELLICRYGNLDLKEGLWVWGSRKILLSRWIEVDKKGIFHKFYHSQGLILEETFSRYGRLYYLVDEK